MRTIVFEDDGQDFLEWDVDEKGVVVDCRPFQQNVWNGTKVVNAATCRAKSKLLFKNPSLAGVQELRHRVKKAYKKA